MASPRTALDWIEDFISFVRHGIENVAIHQWPAHLAAVWRYWTDTSLTESERAALGAALRSAGTEEQDKVWEFLGRQAPPSNGATLYVLQGQFANEKNFPDLAEWQSLKAFRDSDDKMFQSSGVYGVVLPGTNQATAGFVVQLAVIVRPSEDSTPQARDVRFLDMVVDSEADRSAREAVSAAEAWLGWKGLLLLAEYVIRSDFFVVGIWRSLLLAKCGRRLRKRLQGAQVYIRSHPPQTAIVRGGSLGLAVLVATLLALSREGLGTRLPRWLRRWLSLPSWSGLAPRILDSGFSGGLVDRGTLQGAGRIKEKVEAFAQHGGVRRVFFPLTKQNPKVSSTLEVNYCRSTRKMLRALLWPRLTWLAVNLGCLLVLFWLVNAGWKQVWPQPVIETITVESEKVSPQDYLLRGKPLEITRESMISLAISAGRLQKDTVLLIRSGRVDASGQSVRVLKRGTYESSAYSELRPPIRDGMVSFVYSNPDPAVSTDTLVIEIQCLDRIEGYYGLNLRISAEGSVR